MKQAFLTALLAVSLGGASSAAPESPRYTNAQIVSVDAQTRLVVILKADGREETLELDDHVAGLDGLRAGDRVILAVRAEPGRSRVSSIVRSVVPSAPAPKDPVPDDPAEDAPAVAPALRAFADRVAALAVQAGQVDALWNDFRSTCNVTLRSSYSDGHDWFSLWDKAAQMDMSGGNCRDLLNQIVGQGEAVKAGMVSAEETARRSALEPGDLREVRRRYSMEWGGWGLPAPDPLKQ